MPEAAAELREVGSVAEAVAEIRAAQADRAVLWPCGRRRRLARHAPEAAPARWLGLARLDRLLELDIEDQTCVVEPGLSPAALDAALAEHGLELGALAPAAESGTLGGLFLAPDVSLLHGCCGPPRDQVLGADWLLADGSAVRSGARVVKSVAGYDLTRLFLGSRGRLAACTRLTLRLRPRPRRPLWLRAGAPDAPPPPAPRLWFQAGPEEPAVALLEDLTAADAPGWEELDAITGADALARALAAFGAAPVRVAWPGGAAPRPLPPALRVLCSALDWAGGQAAVPAGAAALDALRAAAGDGLGVVPRARPSRWLAALQEACAPGGWPFGGRPS